MKRFFLRLRSLLRSGRDEPELDREIASHLALFEEEHRRRGLTPEEARMFEYGSTGPGAGPVSATRKLIDAAAARRFTEANVLGDWR